VDFSEGFGEHSPGFLEIVVRKDSLGISKVDTWEKTFLGAFRRFLPAVLIGTSIRRGMVFSRHGWCEGWMINHKVGQRVRCEP